MASINSKVALAVVGGTALLAFAALFIKNSLNQKKSEDLSKQKVMRILKLVRKENYLVFKQVATFVLQMAQQFQNSLSEEMIQAYLNGPQSPYDIKAELEKKLNQICEKNQTTDIDFTAALEQLKGDKDVEEMLALAEKDYKSSLKGMLPDFTVEIPPSLTKQKVLEFQNLIAKETFLFQIKVMKKMSNYSEQEINANPQILKQLGNPEEEKESLLLQQGIGSEYQSAQAVLDAAMKKYSRQDPRFRVSVQRIEQGLGKIMNKYAMKIQSKKMTELDYIELQDEITFAQVL